MKPIIKHVQRTVVSEDNASIEISPDRLDGLIRVHIPEEESQAYFGTADFSVSREMASALALALSAVARGAA